MNYKNKKEENLEDWVKDLQRKIEKEEEKIYSKKVIEEYRNPVNFGIIKKPDAYAEIKGPCNDTMRMYLKIHDNKITSACFWTDGCGATIASGNMLTRISIGKNMGEVSRISQKQLINKLNGLPNEHIHCAKLATDTLKKAIENYHK